MAPLDTPPLPPPPPQPTGEEREVDLADVLIDDPTDHHEMRALVAGSAVGQRMVQIALSQRGVAESGGEDGGVPFERYAKPFGYRSPVPWCACFVSWCYQQTTGHKPPWTYPGVTSSIHSWARDHGTIVSNPSQGDIFGIGDQHTGLVVARKRDGVFVTIEGNWGDRVLTQERPISSAWYATPTFG